MFDGRHGVGEAERSRPQEFRVDIEVEADLAAAGANDRLEETVDYRELRAIARDVVTGESAHLIEALAHRIAERALRLPRVQGITVRVAKRPASMEPLDAAAVEIRRTRA